MIVSDNCLRQQLFQTTVSIKYTRIFNFKPQSRTKINTIRDFIFLYITLLSLISGTGAVICTAVAAA
jgi:hypothetical protein